MAGVPNAVVEAVGAGLPEFEGVRGEPVAAPVTRAGDRVGCRRTVISELSHKIFVAGVQNCAVFDDGTLPGNPGGDLAAARAGVEIFVGFGGCQFGDLAGNANLAVQGFPVKDEGGVRVLGEFAPFLAFVVGEEGEAQVVEPFEQHHAGGGDTIRGGGGEGHRIGHIDPGAFGFIVPGGELGDGVGGKIRAAEWGW